MLNNIFKSTSIRTNSKQLFLDRLNNSTMKLQREGKRYAVKIVNWNISNPSKLRAIRQTRWLLKLRPDVIVLTETKFSKGCLYIRDRLESFKYHVIFPIPDENKYGVLIASKEEPTSTDFSDYIDFLRSRIVSAGISCFLGKLEIIAVYVPNERSKKKKNFLQKLLNALERTSSMNYRIFCGDFNVIEPGHVPQHPKFEDWEYDFYTSLTMYQLGDAFRYLNPEVQEYSWVGRKGEKYRYDHCFASLHILPLVKKCYYIHEPIDLKLSDHSAMYIEIKN